MPRTDKNDKSDKNKTHSKSSKITTCEPIDCFFSTKYTASNVNKMLEIYNEMKDMMICRLCNVNCVDTKLECKDTYSPTFVIVRKNYCLSCWLQKVTLHK